MHLVNLKHAQFCLWQVMATLMLLMISFSMVNAQDQPVKYDFEKVANVDYAHGQLPSAIGVHNIQILRANREFPSMSNGEGWTYNHAPMMAYWNDSIYVSYLSNPIGEHRPPGKTYLQSSKDGYTWNKARVLFPTYRIPDGTKKEASSRIAKDLDAVMHQRMVFYVSPTSDKFFALGYYGIDLGGKTGPVDGKGVGRVIREIKKDGTLGEIYFIRYNHGWNESNTHFPFYENAEDQDLIKACEEILANPLITLQWMEEADRDDPIIPKLESHMKAFCYYSLPNGNLIGMWKVGYLGISKDKGKTWSLSRAKNLIIGSAKMWGEQTSDNKYAQVFNPTINHRYPLVVSPSSDGLYFNQMVTAHNELTPKRYKGNSKKEGPQYVRGIYPGNGRVPDGNLWLTYSMNKEDIWVSKIAVPILQESQEHIHENLADYSSIGQLQRWNIYSPAWAPVSIDKINTGENALKLSDKDRYDFAKVERVFPASSEFKIEFSIVADQDQNGSLDIELQNEKNTPGIRISFDPDGEVRYKRKHRHDEMISYKAGEVYKFELTINTHEQTCSVLVNGQPSRADYHAPINQFSRIVFRTGKPVDVMYNDMLEDFDLADSGTPADEFAFYILSLKTENLE